LQCDNNDKSRTNRTNAFEVGPKIGSVDVLLHCQTQNAGPCTSMTLIVNVERLKPGTSYDVYIADNSCPLHNSNLESLFVANRSSDSSGLLLYRVTRTGTFKPSSNSENVCIYD